MTDTERLYPEDVEAVWAKYGRKLRSIVPGRLLVYAPPPPQRTPGGLYLPTVMTGMWTRRPTSNPVVQALVVARAPNYPGEPSCNVEVGAWIFFPRLNFGYFHHWVGEDAYLGWVPDKYVAGYEERPSFTGLDLAKVA